MKKLVRIAAGVAVASTLVLGVPATGGGSPAVGSTDETYGACGRVFPDPHAYWPSPAQAPTRSPFAKGNAVCASADFLTYGDMIGGLEYLEGLFPQFVEFYELERDFGDGSECTSSTSNADLCSAGLPRQGLPAGRVRSDLYMVRVTDERVADDAKKFFTFPLSIHGIERAGAEAGVRAAEDLATTSGSWRNSKCKCRAKCLSFLRLMRQSKAKVQLCEKGATLGHPKGPVSNSYGGQSMRKPFVFALLCLGALAVLPGAHASNPSSSTVSAATPSTWIGGPFAASSPSLAPECVDSSPTCDTHALTVVAAPGNYSLEINVTAAFPTDDYDLYVYDSNGVQVGSDGAPPGIPERVVLENPPAGVYTVKVLAFLVVPGSTYTATATLHGNTGTVITDPNPETVIWDWNRDAPQATVEVPLRVVAVGFAPGALDAAKVLGEVADYQRPGVLIPRGNDTNGDTFPLFGAETLVNHGRRYYQDSRPFLVPYEYEWKPELVYAPSGFASALFGAMKANSTTGEFANSRGRQFIEGYNTTRGAFRGTDAVVPPNHPVRFVDGEKTEDWIAANAPAYLGFDHPKRGKGAGTNPGYTVYVLNTWDSAEARAQLQPQREYHVFKVNRTDPDTQQFDGIDWARIWGGRYRFMMLDLGAAPNPYEAETWGNRNRSVYGSANYDPPLWEYRANAPRPVTLTNVTEGEGNLDVEQAVTPGETWDEAELNRMLGRTVGQAVSFRFLHSYLYEPWPSTGKYWLSDNVWHDANAALPWASDLTKLYNQETVMAGLRTLTPYFEFQGDTVFEYLQDGGTDFAADQAMLEQAKRDGDDIGGVPGAGMHTVTAMDYLDSKPDRFLRGGPCFTTVPGISVVAEKHYAWALAIAAGIATNRNGVPWGYLNSVNDVFKTPRADRDETMRLAHPEIGTGAFTYTAIHEASHYLGLAHPHDSIGAVRNADGSPRYYDGFTWAFNSTAAPTTYSHTELVYSILDQESIARGHAAYYLKWTNEALTDGGVAYWQSGVKTVGALPDVARKLRDRAVTQMAKARAAFSRFEFVTATFAAQAAWRAAAAYRDLALALPPGTTEIEKGTQKAGASACASAKEPGR